MLASSTPRRAATAPAPLAPELRAPALGTLTRAFAADPPCRWVWPDAAAYREFFPRFAAAFGGAAIDGRTALATGDLSGVALWMAPGVGPDEAALASVIEASVGAERRGAVFDLFAAMGRVHPTEPHWYLPLIGVAPGRQGRGIGAALLRPVLAAADAAGLPAYLEATSPASVPLYSRHGFAPLGAIRVGGSPPIVPMLRPPARGGASIPANENLT
jgi:GNAT superfamily N-acetyltransferase